MRVDLRELRAYPGRPVLHEAREMFDDLVWCDEPLPLAEAAQVTASVFFDEGRLFVTLKVAGKATRTCSRCLVEAEEAYAREELVEIPLEDPRAPYLELRPWIAAAIRLAVDPRPLCRSDCRGLCAACGADLNQEDHRQGCTAFVSTPDPRLEKLKDLL